jgi:hypothetical protein
VLNQLNEAHVRVWELEDYRENNGKDDDDDELQVVNNN